LAGVKNIREAIESAQEYRRETGKDTVLFVDEVHRFNKAQQDAFLPYVEDGTLLFIGATTENPAFEVNNALLSRTRVYVLKSLSENEIISIVRQALTDEVNGLGKQHLSFPEELQQHLVSSVDGDARRALNILEILSDLAEVSERNERIITEDLLASVLVGGVRRFDKGGDAFYDMISALHKSVRGSNPDAALYWMARMLDGGCDPLYIARRVVRMASEDIGNADPRALQIALNAWEVQERLGSPEGELAIAQAVVFLASAAKSNAVYVAFNEAMSDARNLGSLEVPLHLRNAPTKLAKSLGYGKEYRYAHDEQGAYAAGETYLPEKLQDRVYYRPVDRGLEKQIGAKLDSLRRLNAESYSKSATQKDCGKNQSEVKK
jgi:putative ATPase